MTMLALVLFGLLLLMVAAAIPLAVVAVRLSLEEPDDAPPQEAAPRPDRTAEVEALGFARSGSGRWVRGDGGASMELDGFDEDGALRHVQRLRVDGGWTGVKVAPGPMPSVPTGDAAFDRAHVVAGEALHRLDDAVRGALSVEVDAWLSLEGGRVVAIPEADADLAAVVEALDALREALDASPSSDAELAADPSQLGAVRAEALRRCRDVDLARGLLDDGDPEVRLLAALLADPTRLRGIVLDASAPAGVRHKAASALPCLDDDLLRALAACDAPELWSLVAKTARPAEDRVALLRVLLRPGALDAAAWPADHRAPHVGVKLAAALGEAPPPDAEALLLQLLKMPDPRVRLQAARSLAEVGGLAAVPALWRRVDADEDPDVRKEARRAAEALEGTARGGVSLAPVGVGQGAVSVLSSEPGALSVPDEGGGAVPEGTVRSPKVVE